VCFRLVNPIGVSRRPGDPEPPFPDRGESDPKPAAASANSPRRRAAAHALSDHRRAAAPRAFLSRMGDVSV
jgi:hypothetical protein